MSNFHDDAVQLMTDILNLLNEEAQSGQVGDSSLPMNLFIQYYYVLLV